MRWPWQRSEVPAPSNMEEATKALEVSRREGRLAVAKGKRVTALAADLDNQLENNHFAERIRAALGG